MFRAVVATTIIIFFSSPVFALTLEDAVTTALKQNPDLRALRLEAETATAQLDKAQLPLISNPSVETYGSKKEKAPEEGSGRVTN
jgi:outer membrane protein TolC